MHLPPEYDRWMVDHHGVTSRTSLIELGLTPRQVDRIVLTERLVAMTPGVYRSPAHPEGPLQLMVATCLRHPEAVIGFTTAGREWRFRGMSDRRIHVLLPHRCNLDLPGVTVHRCRRIDQVDVTARRPDGIRLTSPPRTLFDAASIIGAQATASAVEQALAERRFTFGTLMSTSRRLHHHLRPGAVVMHGVLMSRPAWRGAARSDLELVVIEAINRHGLPAPVVNMPYRLSTGECIVVDLAWPQWKVAAEVDHPFWHDGALESARDKRRDRKLASEGWATPRLPELDINRHLDELMDDLRQILVVAGWSGR